MGVRQNGIAALAIPSVKIMGRRGFAAYSTRLKTPLTNFRIYATIMRLG